MKPIYPDVGVVPLDPLALFVSESLRLRSAIMADARRLGLEFGTPAHEAFLTRQGCPQELTLTTLVVDMPRIIEGLQRGSHNSS